MPRFGAHMSTAGGLENGIAEAVRFKCDALQIFVKNQRQWNAPPLTGEQARAWFDARSRTAVAPVVVHDSYLINLGSPDAKAWQRSLEAIVDELERCDRLGIELLVTHPGSHVGAGEEAGIANIVRAMDALVERLPKLSTRVLLEVTAGQGTNLGCRFEQIAAMIGRCAKPEAFGVCLDTCHAFAAGYDIRTPEGVACTLDEFDATIGLERLHCIHLNDSKRELGSRVDRHEHIGLGMIGARGLAAIVREPRLAHLPMILETPKGTDPKSGREYDAINLGKLRRYLKG
ncbi:MAG: Endonuclease 4 [Phycisphaerae bacterium]|nr:Endonuclease 4 [Phycisphaerae bacterium]